MDNYVIRNCGLAGKCPMTWQSLASTEQPEIRYCPKCDRGVHLCQTQQELMDAMRADRCVAILVADDATGIDPDEDWFEEDDTYLEQ